MTRSIKNLVGIAAVVLVTFVPGSEELNTNNDYSSFGLNVNIRKAIQSTGVDLRDDPQSRFEWERMRLADPETGEIPAGIAESSMAYAMSQRVQYNGGIPLIPLATSTDLTWSARGPYNVGGRTRALAIDLADVTENTYLAGGVSGGMWRTTDGGSNWTKTTSPTDLHSVTAVAQDPNATNIWYYSTGELIGNSARLPTGFFTGDGIYRSSDSGESWTVLSSTVSNTPESREGDFDIGYSLVVNGDVNMDNNTDVYAAVEGAIRRSEDGGETWSLVLDGSDAFYTDIIVTNNNIYYATISNSSLLGAEGIHRSTDGSTWENITPSSFSNSPGRIVLDYSRQNDAIYVLAHTPGEGTLDHMLFKYEHDGDPDDTDWTELSANIPAFGGSVGDFDSQQAYDLYVKVNPADENLVFLGGTNIYRSTDGFTTNSSEWIGGYSEENNIGVYPGHHPDQHNLLFFESNPNKALSAHDGGVSITSDITDAVPDLVIESLNDVTWNSLNNGYLTTQTYAVAIDPLGTSDSRILAGFQDNGTWFTSSSSLTTNWSENLTGDGSYCAIADNGLTRYVSAQNGQVFRFNYSDANATGNNFTNVGRIDPTGGSGYLFINPFILDTNNDNIMYVAGGSSIWRNNDLDGITLGNFSTTATNWEELSSASPSGSVSALAVSTNVANRLYFGTSTGAFRYIDNANTGTPTPTIPVLNGYPANGYVSSIYVDPEDHNNVFVTFSNFGVTSVWNSTDAGDNWADISGNLEENADGSGSGPSVRWFSAIDNGLESKYFAATSTGLYSTSSLNGTSTNWTLEDPMGIGNVVVDMVVTRPSDGAIVVGTHANGVYSSQFAADPGTLNPPINLMAEATSSSGIQLTWTDNTNIETGYQIEISTTETSGFSVVNEGIQPANTTLFNDTDLLLSGQTYFYRIAAVGTDGNSEYSTVVSATTFGSEPPSNLTATSVSAVTVTMSWTDNTQSESEFEIERSTDNETFFLVGDVDANETSYTDLGLTSETTYYYRVAARVDGDLTDYSNVLTVTTSTPALPSAAPDNLNATVISSTEIRINWTDQSTNESSFTVERSDFVNFLDDDNARVSESVAANSTSFNWTGLLPGSTYYFRVRATNEEGSTSPSNTVSATTDVASPDAPSDLEATNVTNSEISLIWQDNSLTETGYSVQIATETNTNFVTVGTLDPDTEGVTITGLQEATAYSIRVVAVNATGESPSGVIKVTTLQGPPEAPTNLGISVGSDGTSITLGWSDNSDNEIAFILERSFDNVDSFEELAELEPDVTSFEDTIDPEINVFYRVRAFNTGGFSDFSNVTSNVLTAIAPEAIASQEINIYPNPSSGMINLTLGFSEFKKEIEVLDYSGRLHHYLSTSDAESQIDLTNLNRGLYLLKIRYANGHQELRKLLLTE